MESTALRNCVEQLIAIRMDLRYFGVPIDGPSIIFGDNKAVIDTSMNPSYHLKKWHNILAYHKVCEEIASNIVCFYHIDRKNNPVDVLTKFQISKEWYELMKPFIFCTWRE